MAHAIRLEKTGGPEVLAWQEVAVGKPGRPQRVHVARVIEVAAHIRLKRQKLSVIEHERKPPSRFAGEALIVLADPPGDCNRGHIKTEISSEQRRARNVVIFDERQHDGKQIVVVGRPQALEKITGDSKSAAAAQGFNEQIVVEAIGIADAVTLKVARV